MSEGVLCQQKAPSERREAVRDADCKGAWASALDTSPPSLGQGNCRNHLPGPLSYPSVPLTEPGCRACVYRRVHSPHVHV